MAQRSSPPQVSVVLPTYRRPEMLAGAIESVVRQTHADWELIIVDDNGRGTPAQLATEAVIEARSGEPRLTYVVHDENRGACAARNTGIARARGPFVAFLDDDDLWYRIKLERQLERFAACGQNVAVVYSGYCLVDAGGGRHEHLADGIAHTYPHVLMRNGIGTTSMVLCRRDALSSVGGFDERLPSMQDFDLYVRLAQRYEFAWVEEPLLDYVRHHGHAIGKDYSAAVEANQLFYEKHRALFEGDPTVHHQRLRAYGLEVMRSGKIGEARRLLWRAWTVKRSEVATLLLALTLNAPALRMYRVVRATLATRFRPG